MKRTVHAPGLPVWQDNPEQQQQGPEVAPPPAESLKDYTPPPLNLDEPPVPPTPAPVPPPPAPAAVPPVVPAADADPFAPIEVPAPASTVPPVVPPVEPVKPPGVEERANENRGLREQLAEHQRRLAEFESAQVAPLKGQLTEREKRIQELEGRLNARDPMAHPEVVALRQGMATRFQDTAREITMNGDDATGLQGILEQAIPKLANAGDPTSAPYLAAIRDLRQELLEKNLRPESISAIARLADQGVRNGYETNAKIREIGDNWQTYEAAEALKQWTNISKGWASVKERWFAPSDDQIANDPYNPVVYLAKVAKADESGAIKGQLDATAKAVIESLMPMAPVMPEDLQGMDPAHATEYLERRANNYTARQENFRAQIGPAMAFMRLGPSLLKRIKELEDKVTLYEGSTPVPDNEKGQRGPEHTGGPQPQKIADFVPPPLPD